MPTYKQNPQLDVVFLPSVGKLKEGQILVGSEFSRFAPKYLVEIPEEPSTVPLESTEPAKPRTITEPAPYNPAPVYEAPSRRPERLEEIVGKARANKAGKKTSTRGPVSVSVPNGSDSK